MDRHVERSIEVAVPVRTAYDQWTQFEEFPRFMGGVQEVRQVGDALTHWVAEIAGVRREWDAAILEQVPDEKVAWAATSGATNAGAVYFTAVGEACTRVRLTLDYEPEGVVERIGDILDVIDRQAVADLDRFKEFIEQAGAATGTWRGTIEEGDVQDGQTPDERGAHDVEGDVAAVGPTGSVRGTYDDGPSGARQAPGPAAGAAGEDQAGVAGFGTDTGLRGGDDASFTGDPASRSSGVGSTARDSDVAYESDAAYDSDVASTDAEELPLATGHDGPPAGRPEDRLEADDAPEVGEVGSSLDPVDPRAGTADDPANPQRPSV